MLRTLRMVKEKAIDKPTGVDADDKKRIKDIEEAALALERTLNFYCRSFAESNANAAALYLDIANLYPANEALSVSVMTLNSSGGVFRDAGKTADDVHGTLMAPLTALKERLKGLYAKADERQVLRAEIAHYREKVTRLANEGLSNTKAQAKAESNQEKLFRNQQRFRELDTELGVELGALDHEVAELTNAAIARVVQIHATYASGLLHCYGNAIAAIPGAIKSGGPIAGVVMPAATGGAGASAAAAPATGGARTGASPAASATAAAPVSGAGASPAASAGDAPAAMSLAAFTGGAAAVATAASSSPAASSTPATAAAAATTAAAAPAASTAAAAAVGGPGTDVNPFADDTNPFASPSGGGGDGFGSA